MNYSSSTAFILTIAIFHICVAQPHGKDGQNFENLKYTFGEGEELPAGFFDTPEAMEKRSTTRGYPACQDGSGGMCIEAGQCPPHLKAESIAGSVACPSGKECCYGGPMNSRTPCRDRGGECTAPPRSCGNGPQLRNGTECNHNRGEICCIWTF